MPIDGLLLVAHGSPDPDWARPLERVLARLQELHEGPCALAFLSREGSLDAGLTQLAEAGAQRVEVVAALLSAGGRHLKVDLPEQVEAARPRHPTIELELRPGALGEAEAVIDALARAALARSE